MIIVASLYVMGRIKNYKRISVRAPSNDGWPIMHVREVKVVHSSFLEDGICQFLVSHNRHTKYWMLVDINRAA
jgi:hypothetical protein